LRTRSTMRSGIDSVSIPESFMTETGKERREMPRFEMRLPVEVKTGEGNARVMAVTRDVSARGVYILVGSELSQSSDIEFTLTLPPEVTMTKSIRVRCNGQVIRVTRHNDDEYGVAAAIHHYEFLSNTTGANA
jgi:hypothetical protein